MSPSPEPTQHKILIADDDSNTRSVIRRALIREGYEVVEAADGKEAQSRMKDDIAVALFDLRMPLANGMQCLTYVKKNFPNTEVIMLSAFGRSDEIVKSMKHGAFWYLEKPFERFDLLALVGIASEIFQLKVSHAELMEQFHLPDTDIELVARSSTMQELLMRIKQVSGLHSTVLLTGESGTGKTILARMIHQLGARQKNPFVSLSCAAIPRDLIESELFGHESGAFTGATRARSGSFELADRGTLFLDEIGELPLEMQAKLLTVLQDHEVRRVGGSRAKKVDVRVVAATNKDLKEMVKQGTFREDLFFRLNVLSLHVPPLRERLDDIEPLANMFLSNIAKARGQKQQQLSPAVVRGFHEYHWPGNVRELENVLERATAFTNAEILSSQDIDLTFSQSTKREEKSELCFLDLGGYSLEDVERKAIEDTLRLTSGHKAKAAKMLGISTKSIYNKIERYGI